MRLSYSLIQKARKLDLLLPYMLPQCRNIQDANQELIWLKTYFQNDNAQLHKAVLQRYRGRPLQYILKTQPFGNNLTINCKANVLIPRFETDEICTYINTTLFGNYPKEKNPTEVTIVDLCSGSGCISLAIKEANPAFNVIGIDVSAACINLANENKKLNNLEDVEFIQGNVLDPDPNTIERIVKSHSNRRIDMIISNPPYVLPSALPFLNQSVKKYEPGIALFGNLEFYESLVKIWSNLCDSFFFELGELEQFEYIQNHLESSVWIVLRWNDSNNRIRGVYGFRKQSQLAKSISI